MSVGKAIAWAVIIIVVCYALNIHVGAVLSSVISTIQNAHASNGG